MSASASSTPVPSTPPSVKGPQVVIVVEDKDNVVKDDDKKTENIKINVIEGGDKKTENKGSSKRTASVPVSALRRAPARRSPERYSVASGNSGDSSPDKPTEATELGRKAEELRQSRAAKESSGASVAAARKISPAPGMEETYLKEDALNGMVKQLSEMNGQLASLRNELVLEREKNARLLDRLNES